MQSHFIAFGSADQARLTHLASCANGQFHVSATGMQLSSVFVKIAAQCNARDGLVKLFSEKMSEMVANKLMLDYL